jgi:adenylate cyclase
LLQIYVGGLPAERILAGQIRRGEVVGTEAAILLCDLRGSTQLAIDLAETAYIATLNRFFDCVVPAVARHGGDVLKFVGDAVLAIFPPAGAGDCSHCNAAVSAADAILAALDDVNVRDPVPGGPLRVAIALHEGRLAFGNVGSVERQDFTVIGQDVNLAARLCSLSAELDEPLLISERFAAHAITPLRKVGEYAVKGIAAPQTVFAPIRS